MDIQRSLQRFASEPPSTLSGLVATGAAVVLSTLLVSLLKSIAPVVSLGVVYLPAILLISIVWGLRLGLLAAFLSALAFNFFQIPPLYRFTIAEEGNWVALTIFVIAAGISSGVAGLARSLAVSAEQRREAADRAYVALEALTRERDRMRAGMVEAEALRRSDELKTALLRSISHDLRTPLTSMIAGGAALGSKSLTDEDREEMSRALVSEGGRLSQLLQNLLDLSRLEAGSAEPHREPVDLREVVKNALKDLEEPESVRITIGPDLPLVDADAVQLERVFANLLENASRYSDHGPVVVNSRVVDGRVLVRVVDQGPGIPEAERERIFQPFQHGDSAVSGSGLGLAIAKGFVEANGGDIGVESIPGQGTAFVVSLRPQKQMAA